MNYTDRIVDFLEIQPDWRYHPRTSAAAEPTALAALALAAYGRRQAAERARKWLAAVQANAGQVGIRLEESSPGWSTPLAILAWSLCEPVRDAARQDTTKPIDERQVQRENSSSAAASSYAGARDRAVEWLLSVHGETSDQPEYTGHDTTIAGWPWVEGTHSWVEPTAMSLLALKAVGRGDHPRARDAARLLEDRLLTTGGCNYGNTIVLGQTLLPHVQPTGAALVALAGEADRTGRIQQSLNYLEATLGPSTTSASLAYGLLGLAAHGRLPQEADTWLAACAAQSLQRLSSLELALLALAALSSDCPLISISSVHETA